MAETTDTAAQAILDNEAPLACEISATRGMPPERLWRGLFQI
jgi:hypothetical protein